MKIAIVCPEPAGEVLSGIGIRMTSMARALARDFSVKLLLPAGSSPESLALSCDVEIYERDKVGRAVGDCPVAIVQGEPANFLLSQRQDVLTIVDLYDPYTIEALNYGEEAHQFAHASLQLQLLRGHIFLCASEIQKLFYAGALYHAGRLTPDLYARSHHLEPIMMVIPFGVPDTDPPDHDGWLRHRLSVPDHEPLVFFGGVYDWYDTDTLLAVWRTLVREKRAHLVICRHPRADTTPQIRFETFLEGAKESGLLHDTIHVVDWIPYHDRVSAYRDCHTALSFHFQSFETTLSFRTRVLDFLWAGLPVLTSPGGGLEQVLFDLPGLRILKENTVSEGAEVLAEMISRPIEDAERKRISLAIRNRLSWDRVLAPLSDYLKSLERYQGAEPRSWWQRLFP
ncbi:MAG TPA: hypothetical protein PK014_05470 [Thermoanaerobaculia bacterium]|nr:hypothetical protein [Thermoanaerobaculia bacterium]HUM28726.1 hypothetical protein [Thermoanaerobaculia bacterium]HXK68024.1 hypothetical protein [Thermoanaerobaculia bacterium]